MSDELSLWQKATLKALVVEQDKIKWKIIGERMGKSPVSCQKLAKEMKISA